MYPIPANEPQRLAALRSLEVLDTEPEEAFDRLTRLACSRFRTPVALVSLVDEARQWFKSRQGIGVAETHREVAFCGHAILSDEPLVVLDATRDRRFSENALVCEKPGVRFYAGHPLITRQGFRVGTFCVIGFEPRESFSEEERGALADFAAATVDLLELRRQLRLLTTGSPERELATDAQAELFSMVAHEIKSPLAAVHSVLSGLVAGDFDSLSEVDRADLISEACDSSDQALTIAGRMLDFARSQTGDLAIEESDFPLRDVIEVAQRNAMSSHSVPGAEIAVELNPMDVRIRGDRIYFCQMLTNLISNALKYGGRPPEIRIRAETGVGGSLEISVADRGPGMSSEEVERALTPYVRLASKRSGDPGGLGIGLPLVKRLIELHGGRLDVRNDAGVGTTVVLRVPAYRFGDTSAF